MTQPERQKWVEYSDDSSADLTESQPSLIHNPELQKLQAINQNHKYVWLEVRCSTLTQQARKKIKKIRFEEEGNAVYEAKGYDGYDIKVKKQKAKQYIINSIPGVFGAKITIAQQKNFNNHKTDAQSKNKNYRKVQSQHKDRLGSRQSNKKIKYVDKATGKQANNKANYQTRVIEEAERKYSKREANDIGHKLGEFRNNPKKSKQLQEICKEYFNGNGGHLEAPQLHEPTERKIQYCKSEPKLEFKSETQTKPQILKGSWKRQDKGSNNTNKIGRKQQERQQNKKQANSKSRKYILKNEIKSPKYRPKLESEYYSTKKVEDRIHGENKPKKYQEKDS